MAVAIRLSRGGNKTRPFYRIVVSDSRSPRDGKYLEQIGTYNPLLAKDDAARVKLDEDRARYWLGVGAQVTDRVARFLDAAGIRERAARNNPNKAEPGEKAKQAMAASGVDDKVLLHMDAIIGSMTPKERTRPELLNAKRKKRVAAGSGTQVQDINKLLKMHQEMGRAMKQIRKLGGVKGLSALFGKGGLTAPGAEGLPGLGGPGMGGTARLPPDLQNLLKKN